MSDDRDRDEDPFRDVWIANWEQQCIEQIENEPDYEKLLQTEREFSHQKLWCSFQSTATAIAQLYKCQHQQVSLWVPFQNAAGTSTVLYKESSDALRRTLELGLQCGYQRRNKELMNWVRKKRRYIRREDLLSYLAGKNLPPPPPRTHHRSSPKPRYMLSDRRGSPNAHQMDLHHAVVHSSVAPVTNIGIDDSILFREALSISSSSTSRRQRSTERHELTSFISSEFARHYKRPAPPSPIHDVNMDSPTQKRARYLV